MNSEPASQPDSIDLAYDMWAGQFEFVGPSNEATTNNNNNNNKVIMNNNALNGDRNASHKRSTDSLEDLNLNFNTTSTQHSLNSSVYSVGGSSGGGEHYYEFGSKQPMLNDQETFLSLNPADFDDIVPSTSGPNSLVFIENKLDNDESAPSEHNNNNNNNNNKIISLETLSSKFNNCNKANNTNTNGFNLEHLKNFKNKLIADLEEKATVVVMASGDTNGNKVNNGLSVEICENLNEQLELLQRQVTDLADTQNCTDDRTSRAKADYAVLQARYHMLEEQHRDAELRHEERLAAEEKRYRELVARTDRDAAMQKEMFEIKMKNNEIELNSLRDENTRLRLLCDKQSNDLHRTEEKLEIALEKNKVLQEDLLEAERNQRVYEQEKKATAELMLELHNDMERLRTEALPAMPTTSPETIRLEELHHELEEMRRKCKLLEEQNEELQAAVLTRGVEEGRHLLNGTMNSLAQELAEMSQAQLQKAYQEKEDENTRLKHYIDTILLNIVENYPQLLEVKPVQRK